MGLAERGGISVEDPCLFTYGGRWYYFTAMISNPDVSVGAQNLDNKHLELFEYTNEINSLCLYGNIIYVDIDGSISRFFNRIDNHLEVTVMQVEKVTEGDFEVFVPCGRENNGDYFIHNFIVQNIGILNRDKQAITYQISLLSTLWYCLCSELEFSNYPADEPETEDKPKNGFKILKYFLSQTLKKRTDIKIDTDTFDAAAGTSKTLIPYIVNGNDNIFSVLPYIFNRLYWNAENIETSLKFIVFDPVMWTYKCVDYSDPKSWLACTKSQIIMSMFETDYEQMLFSVNNNLAAMVGKPQTQTYEDMFQHKIWKYDPLQNDFTFDKTTLETKALTKLFNSRADVFNTMGGKAVQDKYPQELRTDWFVNENAYHHQASLWNSDFSIYRSILDNLMKRDAWVVNTEGDVTHQPGTCMAIDLDRTIEKVPEMTPSEKEELYQKHRQMEMLFPVLKVQHRYHLATRPGADASYTENVVLGRNFIIPPGP